LRAARRRAEGIRRTGNTDLALRPRAATQIRWLGDLPEELLPHIADAAIPYAVALLEQALTSSAPERPNQAVRLWRDIAIARPDEAGPLARLGTALRCA
jgi:hypothetical protein